MNEERPPSPFRWITTISILFLIPLFGVVIFKAGEQVKQTKDFCVSCHLDNGEILHGKKHKAMFAHPPQSLAGLHVQTKKGPRNSCFKCHEGTEMGERLMTAWYELKNTVTYLFGTVEEPKKLSRPFRDESCTVCHDHLKQEAAHEGYHSFSAHDGVSRVACVGCHPMHEAPEEGSFYRRDTIEEKCAACHKSPEQTYYVVQALQQKAFPQKPAE